METIENEWYNPLETFLLVLVEFGLSTPYELLSKAGLGPGLTSPVLKRLKEAGLLTSKPGPRNRQRYAITKKGRKAIDRSLESGRVGFWRLGLLDLYGSLPRGIVLSWLLGGIDEARNGVIRAGEDLMVLAQKTRRDADELRTSMLRLQADIVKHEPGADEGMLVATTYQWIKAVCDAETFMGQSKAIGSILKALADFPPAPQLR